MAARNAESRRSAPGAPAGRVAPAGSTGPPAPPVPPEHPALPARRLSSVLRLSAAYDLLAFALLIWMPPWLLSLWRHPLPAEPFLFRLAALPLLMLPLVYLSAAIDPGRHPELVRLSIALRLVGGVAIGVLVTWQRPVAPGPYVCFALGDLAWAGLYVLTARAR